MGIFPDSWYEDYVSRNATGFERHELLNPTGDFVYDISPDEGWKASNIRIAFDSMPYWMGYLESFTRYLSLRLDDSDFKLFIFAYKNDKINFQREVLFNLNEIKKRRSGQALLAEFDNKPHGTIIRPYNGDDLNADVVTVSNTALKHATAPGKPVNYHEKNRVLGEGGGAPAIVEFDPYMFTDTIAAHPGFAADEILYHELVHASRFVGGVIDNVQVDRKYDTEEEFLAIILTNIYISDKNKTQFRANHGMKMQVFNQRHWEPPLSETEVTHFLDNPQQANMSPARVIENFRNSQRDFYNKLAHLPTNHPKVNWVLQYDLARPHYLQKIQGNFMM